MKPHEQEWEHTGSGVVWNKERLADLVHRPTDGHAQSADETQARGDLIAAAPVMARALIPLAKATCAVGGECGVCPSCRARAVLVAAGVSGSGSRVGE